MMRVMRIILNSFALILLAMLAYAMWYANPMLAILLALAAFDQFEDVYYYVYRRHLFPMWFMAVDVVLELLLFLVGLALLLFSMIYYSFFATWFFRMMIPLSVLIMYSAIEDIVIWWRLKKQYEASKTGKTGSVETSPSPPKTGALGVMAHVCAKEEVCEEKRFVRRKRVW